jgi:hypothetical protein
LKNKREEIDPEEFNLVVGDCINSPQALFDPLTITQIIENTIKIEPPLSALLAPTALHVPGSCPELWSRFVDELSKLVSDWIEQGVDSATQLVGSRAISNFEEAAQISDLAEFSRKLALYEQEVTRMLSLLDSLKMPDVSAGRAILEALEEKSYTRLQDWITHGEFGQLFSASAESATRAGQVANHLAALTESMGVRSTPDQADDMGEPLTIIDEFDENEELSGGYLSELAVDFEEDGEEF